MRIVFLGCVDFSYHCLNELIKSKVNIVSVISRSRSDFHSDFKDLGPLAKEHRIPSYDIEDINSEKSEEIIRQYNPDVIFCFGWSQIIKPRILQIPPMGIIGVHPAALPQNRGRHPLIWAICLGLEKSKFTIFKLNELPDEGDLLSQKEFPITYHDDASIVYRKIKDLAASQMNEIVELLENGKVVYTKQNLEHGNFWRKRSSADGKIDWRMSSRAIYNLVRALTKPYLGAHCFYQNESVKIWKVKEILYTKKNIEPGKVLSVNNEIICVKVYDGAIEIINHEFKKLPKVGEYLTW